MNRNNSPGKSDNRSTAASIRSSRSSRLRTPSSDCVIRSHRTGASGINVCLTRRCASTSSSIAPRGPVSSNDIPCGPDCALMMPSVRGSSPVGSVTEQASQSSAANRPDGAFRTEGRSGNSNPTTNGRSIALAAREAKRLSSSYGSTAESTVTGSSVANKRPRSVRSIGGSSRSTSIVTLSGRVGSSSHAAAGSLRPGVTKTGICRSLSRSKPFRKETSAGRLATEASKLLPVMSNASTSRSMARLMSRSNAVNVAVSTMSRASSSSAVMCCSGQSSCKFAACSKRSGLAAITASLPKLSRRDRLSSATPLWSQFSEPVCREANWPRDERVSPSGNSPA